MWIYYIFFHCIFNEKLILLFMKMCHFEVISSFFYYHLQYLLYTLPYTLELLFLSFSFLVPSLNYLLDWCSRTQIIPNLFHLAINSIPHPRSNILRSGFRGGWEKKNHFGRAVFLRRFAGKSWSRFFGQLFAQVLSVSSCLCYYLCRWITDLTFIQMWCFNELNCFPLSL